MSIWFILEIFAILIVYCIIMGGVAIFGRMLKWADRAVWAGLIVGGIALWDRRKIKLNDHVN